jgi:hypothetical protein
MKFISQVLHLDGALVSFREGATPTAKILAQFHRDMGDEHAMFAPELVDLLLAGIKKVIEVVNEQHALARCIRRAAPAEQNVIGVLSGGETFPEMPLGNDFEPPKLGGLKRRRIHRDERNRGGRGDHCNRQRKTTILAWGNVGGAQGPNQAVDQTFFARTYSRVVHRPERPEVSTMVEVKTGR